MSTETQIELTDINENTSEKLLKSTILDKPLSTRDQEKMLEIFRISLLSLNSKTLKYSIFLLQKVIQQNELIPTFRQSENHWNTFFLLFETLKEQQIHLVLPQLEIFKERDLFDDFWLNILILKALQNENLKTRFKIIEFMLKFRVPTRIIANDPLFLIPVLESCSRQIYYQDALKGRFKSEFGELVAGYISSLDSVLSEKSYELLMKKIVKQFLLKIQSRIPSIYILEGLIQLGGKMNFKVYGMTELIEITSMLSSKLGKSIFKTVKTRALMAITICRFIAVNFEGLLSIDAIVTALGSLIPSNEVYDEIIKAHGAAEQIQYFVNCSNSNDECLKTFLEEFIASSSIKYGEYEKQICAGISSLIRIQSYSIPDAIISEFTKLSTPRVYMVILALAETPNFQFTVEFKRKIVQECILKLKAVDAFDIADLICRMLSKSLEFSVKYPELLEIIDNQRIYQNYNLWLYVSLKIIIMLYNNGSISVSKELPQQHFQYLNLNIAVDNSYESAAIQIFNKSKYLLLCHLCNFGETTNYLFEFCSEQLEICSFENLEFIYDSLIFLLTKLAFTPSELYLLSKTIRTSTARFEKEWKSSQSWFKIVLKFVDFIYSPLLLPHIIEDAIETTKILLKWSETRMGIMNPVSKHLTAYWSTMTNFSVLKPWIETMIDLCYYGPDRQSLDLEVRMETLVLHKLSNVHTDDERYETCQWDFNCQDFVVRVYLNLYFMNLESSNFTWLLITAVLERLESKLLKRKNYKNSLNQKLTMRLGMSLQVLIGVCPDEKKSELLQALFKGLTFEKVVESMAWIEWAIARLVLENLNEMRYQFFAFFKECNKISHCAHSMVLICLQLIPLIQDPILKSEFTVEAILLSLSWSGNKLYTIRVLTQYLIATHYFNHPRLENLSYFLDHISQNQDSQKAFSKIKQYHFYNDFNPTNVTAEFIFRGFLTMMEYSIEERISSLAFVKVCQETGRKCSFALGYESRVENQIMMAQSIRPRIDDLDTIFPDAGNCVEHNPTSSTNGNIPHQRKIVSWQTFMSTDIELSGFRNLTNPKPRLQLQIIASLISKPVNLGGLTRTCETFSCGLLCMDTLDVVKDPSFLSTCVSAEKWCPFKQVRKADILSYISEMKSKDWSVIGIEQATTSSLLNEFKFPLKTVLLLGKEKEGIPADLLLACDHIVEIPQSGMIKSLNVHVSGSLVLYEYFRQHGTV